MQVSIDTAMQPCEDQKVAGVQSMHPSVGDWGGCSMLLAGCSWVVVVCEWFRWVLLIIWGFWGCAVVVVHGGLYTPPHIPVGLHLESSRVQMEFWSPSTIFSLVATQPNISLESAWSLPGVQQPSRWTHLDWMDSTSEHRELLINPARLIITSLLLLLYNTKKSMTSMNWTCNLRSTATLSSMNAQPVGPQRLIYIDIFYAVYTNWLITFLERMLANSDARFGIINQQQPLAFNHHPWHLAPLPPCHYHPQQPLPLTAAIDHLQPQHTTNNRTTNGDVAMPHHKPQWPPAQPEMTKNTQKWTQMTPLLTNDGQHPWTDTSNNEPRWDSSPPPHLTF